MTDTVEPLTVTRHERTATTKRWYHGLRYLFAMPTQSFRFGRWLRRYDLSSEIEGPRFHRWLPNGESDALVLKTDDPAADLRVWFERQGRMDGAFFQFAHKEQSFDPAVITRQGVLEAGPLYGQLDIDLSAEDTAALQESSEHGQTVAKRILHLIHAPASKLITTLRTHYGQYWLEEWKPWDSRRDSLQAALTGMSLRWREPSTGNWERVKVGENVTTFVVGLRRNSYYREFLTQEDWRSLEALVNTREPSPTAIQICLTHEALEEATFGLH